MDTEEIVEAMTRIVATHLGDGYSVRLFGSRASGTHRPGSDYDFMLHGPEKVPFEKFIAIRQEAANLPTLLKIDVVDQANYPDLKTEEQQ